MADYSGTAELLDSAGNVVDTVRVYLHVGTTSGGLKSWGGHIEPATFEGGDWDPVRRIRLPDGNEADIFITKVNIRGDNNDVIREGQIQGSGPPPF